MKSSRRRFIRDAGLAGLAAVGTASLADQAALAADASSSHPDPKVKAVNGPFGEGLPITVAGYDYNRVAPLTDGRVTIDGCALTYEVTGIGPLNNHAFYGPQTRHVTEIGLIPYILAFANGDFRDYALLPIPVLRMFRHKSIWVRADRGIEKPTDLRGRKVATVGYSSSGLTHIRGVLKDEYGVLPEEIQWFSTGKDSASNLTGGVSNWEKVRPEGLEIIDAPADMDESDLMLAGEVDAIFHPAEPRIYQERNPVIKRLFEDFRPVELDYFKRTGIFPIMHSIAIRRDTLKENPWLAKAVFAAYSKAKAADMKQMHMLGWAYDTLPWYGQEYNDTVAAMGRNFYPYGYEASAKSYDTACRYLHEQGLSKYRVTLDNLFVPSVRDLAESS